jgi:NAD(P)-dependent dehydrogenase (short-subunit alcohol dehydrogenase family)
MTGGEDWQTALVTGAAGGIGAAVVAAFAAAGYTVAAVDRDADGLDTLCGGFAGAAGPPGRVSPVVADITSDAGAAAATEGALATGGHLDVLVNVVGGSRPGKTVTEIEEGEWNAVVGLNLTTVYLMSRAVIPHLRSRGGGAIVNVASGAGARGMRRNPAYCAAKAGVIGLTRALAIDHAGDGIRVNCVSPGAVLTPLMRRNRTPDEIEAMSHNALTGYVADPAEIAAVILFLAGAGASYIAGETIAVDGGIPTPV